MNLWSEINMISHKKKLSLCTDIITATVLFSPALGRSIFLYGFLNSNNVQILVGGWVRKGKGSFELETGKKICTP